jgi:hypothetical protein
VLLHIKQGQIQVKVQLQIALMVKQGSNNREESQFFNKVSTSLNKFNSRIRLNADSRIDETF